MSRAWQEPGLQPERTLLSWQRTVALLIVVALLYLRDPLVPGEPDVVGLGPLPRMAVSGVAVMTGAVLVTHVRRRWKAGSRGVGVGEVRAPLARPWGLYLTSVSVAGFGIVIAAGVVLS